MPLGHESQYCGFSISMSKNGILGGCRKVRKNGDCIVALCTCVLYDNVNAGNCSSHDSVDLPSNIFVKYLIIVLLNDSAALFVCG